MTGISGRLTDRREHFRTRLAGWSPAGEESGHGR